MDHILSDLRYALRTLLRSPAFTVAAIATLGLGIGATAMVFSLINGVLLRALPYSDPGSLVALNESDRDGSRSAFSYPNFVDYRAGMRALSGVAAYRTTRATLSGSMAPERVGSAVISDNLFAVLGVRPLVGRTFRADEAVPGGPRIALIGHGIWQRALGGKTDVVGSSITVNGEPHTIVGVMPAGFRFPENEDVWLPLQADPVAQRGDRYLRVIGRLTAEASLPQAQAEADGIRSRLASEYPAPNRDRQVQVRALHEFMMSGVQTVLYLLLAAVGFVLLIACANVANLLLARAASREREMAVRTALGAGRGRLIGQLLTESAVLGVSGGMLGILLALWWNDLVLQAIPVPLPFWMTIGVDLRVLGFTLAVSLLTAFVFGLAPALQSARANVQGTLKEGRGTTGSRGKARLRSALIVGQLALAMVLLVSGLLMVRSFLAMRQVNPGFRVEQIVVADLSLSGPRYEEAAARSQFYDRVLERVRALPGVSSAGAISAVPIFGGNSTSNFTVDGATASDAEAARDAHRTEVTPGYFETAEVALLRGRRFTTADRAGTQPVAIINQRLAQLFFGERDPVGQRIAWGGGAGLDWLTIVGVVANVKQRDVNQASDEPEIYRPVAQAPGHNLSLVLRTQGGTDALLPVLRREVQALDPNVPLSNLMTMRTVMDLAVWDTRLFGSLFAAFAAVALLLAAVGLYGVIAYTVSQRTREIGVRIALGAQPRVLAGMVVRQGLRLVTIGVGIGLLGAFGMGQLMRGLLFGVQPADPFTFVAVPLLLCSVAMLASYLPARRALRVDPMTALRQD